MYYSPVSADSLWVLIFNFSYPGIQHYEKLQLSFHAHQYSTNSRLYEFRQKLKSN